jgi:quercetin dioxygenase-like cupin family protein
MQEVDVARWEDAEVQAYDPALFTGEVERRSFAGGGTGEGRPGVSWVRFTDGGRSNWHVHRGGQVLHVVEGEGCLVTDGEGVLRLEPGMVVRTPPGVRHWHGALVGHAMTHVAVTCGETDWPDPPDRPEPL